MLPDRVSNPGPLTYESDALPIALRGPAGGALNLEFSLKKKENIYTQLGGPLKLFTSSKGYLSNTPEQPFKSEP